MQTFMGLGRNRPGHGSACLLGMEAARALLMAFMPLYCHQAPNPAHISHRCHRAHLLPPRRWIWILFHGAPALRIWAREGQAAQGR
jgi:hypothetical protein